MLTSVGVVANRYEAHPRCSCRSRRRRTPFAGRRRRVSRLFCRDHAAYASPLLRSLCRGSGRPRGQGTGLFRDVIVADTDRRPWRCARIPVGSAAGRGSARRFPPRLDGPGDEDFADRQGVHRPRLCPGRHGRYVTRRARGRHEATAVDWLFC